MEFLHSLDPLLTFAMRCRISVSRASLCGKRGFFDGVDKIGQDFMVYDDSMVLLLAINYKLPIEKNDVYPL